MKSSNSLEQVSAFVVMQESSVISVLFVSEKEKNLHKYFLNGKLINISNNGNKKMLYTKRFW